MGWAIRLAKHLESMHQHGVPHGAVSPACLLIETGSPERRGVAADVRKVAQAMQFHSPERLRSGQVAPVDDAWALAGTLFTTLTGAWPFGEQRPDMEQRIPHGVPGLVHYGIQDDQLQGILSAALSPDPSRRTNNVNYFRQQLEHWLRDPGVVARLAPLDDEGAEEEAATAMVSMEHAAEASRASDMGAPAAPRPAPAPAAAPAAPAEQDQTVMRELPAHIMALAARAAQGSDRPPPGAKAAPAAAPPDDDDDNGGSTRIAPAGDVAAMINLARDPAPTAPGAFPAPAPAPPAPPARPGPPSAPKRAIRSTQLGMGVPAAPTVVSPGGPPPAPPPPAAPPPQPAPRPGFAPPPATLSSAPPPHDPDEIHTVMHSIDTKAVAAALRGGAGSLPSNVMSPPAAPPARPAPPQRPPPPPAPDDDDDDGGRTVMRDGPGPDLAALGQNRAPAPAWKPAAPPAPAPAAPPAFPQPPPAPGGPGVSALIQETLQDMGGPPPAPAVNPFEPTSGFGAPAPDLGFGGPLAAEPSFAPFGGGMGQPGGMGQAGGTAPQGGMGQQGLAPFGPPPAAPSNPGGPFQPLAGSPMGPGGPMGYGQGQMGGAAAGLEPAPSLDFPAAPMPGAYPMGGPPADAVQAAPPKRRSSLLLICLLVLVLAATLTFIALKYRQQLGIPIPVQLGSGQIDASSAG